MHEKRQRKSEDTLPSRQLQSWSDRSLNVVLHLMRKIYRKSAMYMEKLSLNQLRGRDEPPGVPPSRRREVLESRSPLFEARIEASSEFHRRVKEDSDNCIAQGALVQRLLWRARE